MSDLEPNFEIPFTATPIRGGFAPPTVTFSAGSNRLIVSSWMFDRPTVPLLKERLPDIAGLVAVGLLVALIVVTTRTLRRPQTPGRMYCPRCNYDRTPGEVSENDPVSGDPGDRPLAAEPETSPSICPECGLSGEGAPARALVRGRSHARRLAFRSLPVAVLIFPLGFYASRAITTSKIGLASWPFDWLGPATHDTWPWSRVGTERRQFQRFAVYALIPGTKSAVPLAQFDVPPWVRDFRVSSNGQYAAWVEYGASNSYSLDLMIHTLSAGFTRRVRLGSNSSNLLRIHSFTSDDQAILASILSSSDLSQAPEYPLQLLLVSTETGEPRTIGAAEITATQTAQNAYEIPPYLVAWVPVPEPTWAVLTLGGPSVGRLDSSRGEQKSRAVISLPTADPYSREPLQFESDGTLSQSSTFHVALDGTKLPPIPPVPAERSLYFDRRASPSAFRLGEKVLFTYNNWQRPPLGSPLQLGVGFFASPDNRWVVCTDGPVSGPTGLISSGVFKVWEVPRDPSALMPHPVSNTSSP